MGKREGDWTWGRDQDGWDLDGNGHPGIVLFAKAVQVWSWGQDHDVNVAEVATSFGVPPRAVIEAVEWHPWMVLNGPRDDFSRLMIEHQGE